MTYKTVLLHIDDSAGRAARIDAAASIAQACGGHLTGVALTGVSRLLWFSALGLAMALLGRRLNSPAIWRALDALVALMMWGTAGFLVGGLV